MKTMTKKVTMEDIAGRLNISKNAVSLALRNKPGISDKMRENVLKVANELNYGKIPAVPSVLNILALVPGRLSVRTANSFYAQVCFHMESYAKSLGYNLVIASVDPEEEAVCLPPSILKSIDFMGIIAIGNLSYNYITMLAKLGLRILLADQYYPSLPINSVTSANASGGYILTRHLIENGHKAIEYFGQKLFTSSLYDRWIGYSRAMTEAGLVVRENGYHYTRSNHGEEDRRHIESALGKLDEMPTAVFCGNDHIAGELISVLEQKGLSVPDDISVVGFDDLEIPAVIIHQLTTYHTKKAALACTAVDSIIHYQPDPPKNISIYGEPVFRKSVKNIRQE